MPRQPLNELLYTTFYTLLKAGNISPSIDRMDVVRRECDRLAKRIEGEIKLSVVEKIERLQEAIVPAFKMIEDKLEELRLNKTPYPKDHPEFKDNPEFSSIDPQEHDGK